MNSSRSSAPIIKSIFVFVYILLVQLVDLFADISWGHSSGFDFYKFIYWLVIPLLLSIKHFDYQYISLKNIRRYDLLLLAILFVVGAVAISAINIIPSLKNYYLFPTSLSTAEKLAFMQKQLIWIFSWLIGWEFLHRYFFLIHTKKVLGNHLLWILPLMECLYHIHKPPIEMVAMLAFSFLLTHWTLKRTNIVLPFLAHLIIELQLVVLQAL